MSVKLWAGAGAAVALLVAVIAWSPSVDSTVRATAARPVAKAVETRPRVAATDVVVKPQAHPEVATPPAEPTGALVVVARTFRDEPVAGAVVELHRDTPAPAADLRREAGADGVARFPLVPRGIWSVVARADGFAEADGSIIVPPSSERRITLYLDRGHELRGAVRDAAGSPVPSAVIEGAGRRAVANASGAYVLAGLASGEVQVRARRAGEKWLNASWTVAVPEVATFDVVLADYPTITVTGTVVDDASGAPIEGVVVGCAVREPPPCATDAEGRFRLAGVLPDTLAVITLTKAGYRRFPAPRAAMVPPPSDVVDVGTLRMQHGATIEGTVTSPDGPIEGAEVTMTSPSRLTGSERRDAKTDAAGRFTFASVEAGSTQLSARAPGFIAQSRGSTGRVLDVPEAGSVRADLVFARGAVVEGRVVDDDGHGVPGGYVVSGGLQVTTDADGGFRCAGIVPRAGVPVLMMADGYMRSDSTLDVGPGTTSNVVLRMQRSPIVRGRLLASDGRAIENARVVVVCGKSRDPARCNVNEPAEGPFPVHDDGSFEARVPGSASGMFIVVALTTSHAPSRSAPVAIDAGQREYGGVEVALDAGATIRGRVLADGHGAAGARITFGFAGYGYTAPPVRAVADAAGAFVVEHVAFVRDASVHAIASLQGYTDAEAELTADAPGELVLERPLTIEGIVETRDHAPVAGVHVAAHVLELARGAPDTTASFVFTGADGRFRIERLRPGRYLVIATPRGAPRVKVADPVAAGSSDLRIVVN